MKKEKSDKTIPAPKTTQSYMWVFTLAVFGIIPLVRSCIKKYRYEKEIRPIVEGLRERAIRLDEVITGDTGRIFMLSTNDSAVPYYHWYNGFKSMPNDSLQFQIWLHTEFTQSRFSRDTTVGQVVCVLKDVRSELKDSVGVSGIYFEEGTDVPDRGRYELDRAVIYLREPEQYRGWFVADTFNKDPESEEGKLARRRLKRIKEELEKNGVKGFQMKVF